MAAITDYIKEKRSFFVNHGNEYSLETVDKEYGDTLVSIRRFKCKDNKVWSEILSNEMVSAKLSFDSETSIEHPVRCTVTEYWSDDNPNHRKIYEVVR